MKKRLFVSLLLSLFLIAGCTNNTETSQETNSQDNTNIEQENTGQSNIYETFKDIVKEQENCGDDSEMFVDIAMLWSSKKDNWNIEYYLVTSGEWFKIDERWNLGNTCGFGLPITIELDQDNNLVRYELAKDWSLYDSSIKEMFSEEAYKKQVNWEYTFIDEKSLLEQAEEFFGITIIPEPKNNFECTFCDKLRYYSRTPEADEKLNETNELHFDYTSDDNGKNTIYFGSDWSFEAKWSRDEWTWTRTFGQNENTAIVLNNNIDHVYTRYIIINQTEEFLNTIWEIIQRR